MFAEVPCRTKFASGIAAAARIAAYLQRTGETVMHQQELNQAIVLLVENGYAVSRAANITSWAHRSPADAVGEEEAEELALGKQNYTIKEFCLLYGISRTFFYELIRQGKAPMTLKIGKKVLIPRASAENWQARMEATSD